MILWCYKSVKLCAGRMQQLNCAFWRADCGATQRHRCQGQFILLPCIVLQRCVRQADWASLPFGSQRESVRSVSITADAEQQWTLGSCRGRCLQLTTLEGNRKIFSLCFGLGAAKEQKHMKHYSARFKRKRIEPEAGRFKKE